MSQKPKIGVSACLMGHRVRYDGGHCRTPLVTEQVAELADLVTFCPETGMGLPAPRPSMHLLNRDGAIHLVQTRNDTIDYTVQMLDYALRQQPLIAQLDGFILKKSSPSCGMERLPVTNAKTGARTRDGVGLFVSQIKQRLPLLPLEEEGRLNDPQLRMGFFERVFAYHRWRQIEALDVNKSDFERFHACHKLQLMARGDSYYRELGRLVAQTGSHNQAEQVELYIHRFMQVMATTPSRGRLVNVLQHIMGFFKQSLGPEDKRELLELFEAYRQQRVSINAPLALLRHYLRLHPHEWLASQHFFSPFPDSLAPQSPF